MSVLQDFSEDTQMHVIEKHLRFHLLKLLVNRHKVFIAPLDNAFPNCDYAQWLFILEGTNMKMH